MLRKEIRLAVIAINMLALFFCTQASSNSLLISGETIRSSLLSPLYATPDNQTILAVDLLADLTSFSFVTDDVIEFNLDSGSYRIHQSTNPFDLIVSNPQFAGLDLINNVAVHTVDQRTFLIGASKGIINDPGTVTYVGRLNSGSYKPIHYNSAFLDFDEDQISDALEEILGLDPTLADTDGNGIEDAYEDSDNDSISNIAELYFNTDLNDPLDHPESSFSDIAHTDKGMIELEILFGESILDTCDGVDTFCPAEIINRSTAVIWLAKLLGYTTEPAVGGNVFIDIDSNVLGAGWIEAHYTLGLGEACAGSIMDVDLKFCPGMALTKNSAAKLALLAVKADAGYSPDPAESANNPFTDVDIGVSGVADDGDYADDWIVELYQNGLTEGCNGTATTTPTLFCPEESFTRIGYALHLARVFGFHF